MDFKLDITKTFWYLEFMLESIKTLFSGDGEKALSPVKNPFSKKNVVSMMIYSHQFFGEWKHSATVTFKNGDTEGKQEIKGESVNEVIQKTDAFFKTLE